MSVVGTLPDIPMVYAGLAKWMSCVLYLLLFHKRELNKKRCVLVLGVSLALQILVHVVMGELAVSWWIPCMVLVAVIMFATFRVCGGFPRMDAGYWLVRSFVLAEVTASLEWQLYSFFAEQFRWRQPWMSWAFVIVWYGLAFASTYVMEQRQLRGDLGESAQFCVTKKELSTTAAIGIVTFAMSNLSYVYTNTPFSSPFAREVFNIRTLVDLGGFAFLFAYHVQLCEDHMKAELDSIQNILHTQYAQYRMSRENMELINHKYHDLKHQIAVLRKESDLDKREAYLDEIEQGITDYESQFKTGNGVLDTILTSKGLYCARHGITLTCVADGTLLSPIYVMDLCTIFGNALDNAIECEVKIPDEEKRLIHVTVSECNDFVFIRIENYVEEEPEFQNGLPVTTKGDTAYHGFGVKSIRYSVEKYGGTLTVGVRDGWFSLQVLMPGGRKEDHDDVR